LIEEQLAGLDFATAPGFVVNGLKREQLVAMNSMILHEVFFDGLGEESEPGSELVDALAQDFGSFERWRAEFTAMGKALGGGSGWVLFTWSPRDGRLVDQWAADHTTTLAGGQPIWPSTCTSTPTTSTSAPRPRPMLKPSCRRSAGRLPTGSTGSSERRPELQRLRGPSQPSWPLGAVRIRSRRPEHPSEPASVAVAMTPVSKAP
jgi:hypothetical protein